MLIKREYIINQYIIKSIVKEFSRNNNSIKLIVNNFISIEFLFYKKQKQNHKQIQKNFK